MTALPIPIATIPKGKEELRVELNEYKGAAMFSARCFYEDRESGEYRPGRNGINIKVELLPALASAVLAALNEAKAQQLINDGTPDAAELLTGTRDPGQSGSTDDYAEARSNELDP
jgi:hypothetical protein